MPISRFKVLIWNVTIGQRRVDLRSLRTDPLTLHILGLEVVFVTRLKVGIGLWLEIE